MSISVIPPLKPIVLPLKLLVVEYLRTCTSPLVNPVMNQTAVEPITENFLPSAANDSMSLEPSPDAKSLNNETFNLEKIMMASACQSKYSVFVEKLSKDDINLWTNKVPHWSNIDPYSSISEVDSKQSESDVKNDLPTVSKEEMVNSSEHNLRTRRRTYHSIRPCREMSTSVFYRNMCQESSCQSRRHLKISPHSELSESRIREQKCAVQPPPSLYWVKS